MHEKKNKKTKAVVLLVVLMLLIGGAIGGTLAWLIATTDPVVNTFTVGNITITLTETYNEKSDSEKTENDIWVGKLVPGAQIAKDPKVTVKANSEACWLFVKVEETNNANFFSYNVRTGAGEWTKLGGVDGVYYREVSASASDQSFYVLTGTGTGDYQNGYVTVSNTVTKTMMDDLATAIAGDAANTPKLTFTAYAVQTANNTFSAAQAWNVANGLDPNYGLTP